jgi:hypothetical protein
MIQNYRQAIRLKKDQTPIIVQMEEYVEKYCPDQHIFELMFDSNKYINCERLIRQAIGKNSSKVYTNYDTLISHRFQDVILEDWDNLIQVSISIKTDDDTTPKGIILARPKEPPVRSDKTYL